VNQSCPVGVSTVRVLRFDVRARTSHSTLRWRRSSASSDVLEPSTGTLTGDGVSTVIASDIVLSNEVNIEIVDGETVLLNFTLRHY
jgi:hypothetical protein